MGEWFVGSTPTRGSIPFLTKEKIMNRVAVARLFRISLAVAAGSYVYLWVTPRN